MRIAVMGAGGTGGFFGGCLARAGADVTFIARGAHLAAMRARGLRVESASAGDFTVAPVQVTDTPSDVGAADLVLFCVKSWDVASAIEQMRPLVGANTLIICVQNGIEAPDQLAAAFGAAHVLGGVAQIETTIAEPGVIRHSSANLHHLIFGELDGRMTEGAQSALSELQRGGFAVQLSDDIQSALWQKFMVICGWSGMCAVTRLPIGPIRETPETLALMVRAMEEVEAVARAKGVPLTAGSVAAMLARLNLFGAISTTSMARDLERGNRLEVETLNGAVVRLGHALGVPTPVNEFIYACLKPYANGTPKVVTGF